MQECPFCGEKVENNICQNCRRFVKFFLYKYPLEPLKELADPIPLPLSSPRDTEYLFKKSLYYLYKKEYEQAIKTIEKILETTSDIDIASYNNLGVAHLYLKNTALARIAFRRAYQLDEGNPFVNYNLGMYFYEQNDKEKAKSYLEIYLNAYPEEKELFSSLFKATPEVSVELTSPRVVITPKSYVSLTCKEKEKEVKEADFLSSFMKNVRKEAKDTRLLFWIAAILGIIALLVWIGFWLTTNKKFKETLFFSLVNSALQSEKKGELDKGIYFWEQALKYREEPIVYNHLAELYDSQGKLEKALAMVSVALQLKPNYASAHNNLGIIYERSGDKIKSDNEYQISTQLFKEKNKHINDALAFYRLGNLELAKQELSNALEIDPQDLELYYKLALILSKMQKNKEAEEVLRQGILSARLLESNKDEVFLSTALSQLTQGQIAGEIEVSATPSVTISPLPSPQEVPTLSLHTPVAEVTSPEEAPPTPPVMEEMPSDRTAQGVYTIKQFFSFLANRDFSSAYNLLSNEWQAETSVSAFESAFSKVKDINLTQVRILESSEDIMKIKVFIMAQKETPSGLSLNTYTGVYDLVYTEEGWRINSGGIEEVSPSLTSTPAEEILPPSEENTPIPSTEEDIETF